MKKTREELKKIRGEREWKRRQEEAEFYARFGGGPIAFTRPGPPPAAATPPEPAPPPQATARPASARGKDQKSPDEKMILRARWMPATGANLR
jgi:hypothetical protein